MRNYTYALILIALTILTCAFVHNASADIQYYEEAWFLRNNTETIVDNVSAIVRADDGIIHIKMNETYLNDYFNYVSAKSKEKERIREKWGMNDTEIRKTRAYPIHLYKKVYTKSENNSKEFNITLMDVSYKLKSQSVDLRTKNAYIDVKNIDIKNDDYVLKIGFHTITYNSGTNTITVTGYTEATPCTFQDIYNADKTGGLWLHSRYGITGTDADPVATDRPLRPADYVVLGGASNDLFIGVVVWDATSVTIRVIGTDRDGTSQTEDITITSDEIYYLTKWFKTITHTQIIAFTGNDFAYALVQGQWGVVSRQCTDQFCFNAKLQIGDGNTATWFADTNKHITIVNGLISGNWQTFIDVKTNAVFRVGKLIDLTKKITDEGCSFYFAETNYYSKPIMGDGTIYLYGSIFTAYVKEARMNDPDRCWNCKFINECFIVSANSNIYNYQTENNINHGITILSGSGTYEDIKITGDSCVSVVYIDGGTATVKNLKAFGTFQYDVQPSNNGICYLINCDFPAWTFIWQNPPNEKVYRQYEFDLKVIDKDNVAISGATVKIWDKDSNLVVDTTTDANGEIATQTITRGYYNQANGNTLQDASPHLIKIEKAGYTTYEADFTLEEKTDWLIALNSAENGTTTETKLISTQVGAHKTTMAAAFMLLSGMFMMVAIKRRQEDE